MTQHWTVYDEATGRIRCAYMCDEVTAAWQLGPGESLVQGKFDGATHWINAGVAVEKAHAPIAVNGRRITGIPAGAVVTVNDAPIAVENGECTVPANPEGLAVRIESVPHYTTFATIKGYRARRRDSYPAIGDQIDAIHRGFAHLRSQGVNFPIEVVEWLDAVDAIKAANPKA